MTERRTILIIDDEPDMLALLRTILFAEGFEVTGVRSAQEALEHLARNRTDLIITDIYMAGGDGYQLMDALRHAGSTAPVIAISGGAKYGNHDPLKLAADLGAAATVSKPFRREDFIETVNRVIGGTIRQEAAHGNDADGG